MNDQSIAGCPACKGSGICTTTFVCLVCEGTGKTQRQRDQEWVEAEREACQRKAERSTSTTTARGK